MSNQEYDSLYDQLEQLGKKETGTVLTNSPTVRVGYEAVNELPKEEHPSPMLSLDKTKDREVLRGFIGNHKCLLSWKLDGLTIVLTYENGELVKAVTRGNGIVVRLLPTMPGCLRISLFASLIKVSWCFGVRRLSLILSSSGSTRL